MNRKGFAPIFILLVVLGFVVVGGASYLYFKEQPASVDSQASEMPQATVTMSDDEKFIQSIKGLKKYSDFDIIKADVHEIRRKDLEDNQKYTDDRLITFAKQIALGVDIENRDQALKVISGYIDSSKKFPHEIIASDPSTSLHDQGFQYLEISIENLYSMEDEKASVIKRYVGMIGDGGFRITESEGIYPFSAVSLYFQDGSVCADPGLGIINGLITSDSILYIFGAYCRDINDRSPLDANNILNPTGYVWEGGFLK